jgi:hypothetical protein
MSSPNDVTAKVFDIVYENLVCERRTKGELDFVISKLNQGDAALTDVLWKEYEVDTTSQD